MNRVGIKALVLCFGLGSGYRVGIWWWVDGYRRFGLGYVLCTYDKMNVFGLVWGGETFIDGIGVL
jgi:hypothetical protein